jgi:formylglycine-generating enzyme required for sulfatase activity
MPSRPELVFISGGDFLMGCDEGRDDEKPVHRVELSAFFLARHAVTNREYALFVKAGGAERPPAWQDPRFTLPDQPVVAVSWFEAAAYCRWLEELFGQPFRLPTEAEREFACRAGSTTAYPWGEAPERPMGGYGKRWLEGCPETVGGQPNAFGLFNMADNIHEWCQDWYANDYYAASPRRDPSGPASGSRRASRGGSWRHHVKVTRSCARSSIPPSFQYADYGFRLALSGQMGSDHDNLQAH